MQRGVRLEELERCDSLTSGGKDREPIIQTLSPKSTDRSLVSQKVRVYPPRTWSLFPCRSLLKTMEAPVS